LLAFAVGGLKMFEKIYVRKWTRRDWVLLSIFAVIALAGVAVGRGTSMIPQAVLRARVQ
jgi:hypothetical protein